jgi:methyltransferase (TIGR00027 family)
VVILGAGFDSRAYRMRELLKGTTVFEVDYGPTQEYKKIRVREVLGGPPANLVYVPIDFTRETLDDVLVKAGYQSTQRSVFIWEGVTYYIPENAVRSTLRFIATRSAPRSSVVFDAQSKSFIDWVVSNLASPKGVSVGLRGALAFQTKVASWGEPWIFGFPDDHEWEFLKSVGLDLKDDLLLIEGPDAKRRYLTRRDGSAVALVGPPGSALPFRWGGWLGEAVVPGRD